VDPIAALARCPRCAGECRRDDEHLACDACRFEFPIIGGIDCLFTRPHDVIDQWRFRADEFARTMDDTRAKIVAELAGSDVAAPTRGRLELLHRRLDDHRTRVLAVLEAAGIGRARRTAAEPAGVPGEASITSYYHQIHRDWGWDAAGSTENADAIAAVDEVLAGAAPLGTMLVVGAGACRLPLDVHVRHGATTTLAIDINPLPMLVARRVIAGERLRLLEFPISPPDREHVCVERELACATPNVAGFHLLFADALDPPFAPGRFDTVLTPWFIDQVPPDLVAFLPVVHRLLRPGGRWINHGPLVYHPNHTRLPHRYAMDELVALVDAAGFRIDRVQRKRALYMQSPACTQGRTESVITFVAERGEAPARAAEPELPSWLENVALSVPRFAGMDGYAPPHPLFATVIGLVDGTRSIADIARALVERHNVPAEAATPGVQTCLREIWRATTRG
jgi:SAM-dependent methyltransferase